MGWWSELKKKVKEFFTGEDQESLPDTTPYDGKQKELNETLKKMDEDFKESYDPGSGYDDIADLVPEEVEFVYKEYKGDDEQTIKDKTTSKYEDLLKGETQEVNNKYDGKVNQLEDKKNSATVDSQIKQNELDSEYDKLKKQIENSLIQNGMYRSSVRQGQEDYADAMQALESDKIQKDLSSEISAYDSEIQKLREEEKVAVDSLNLKYAQDLKTEIDKLLEERQKQINDINKYNNDLKVKEAKYTEDRLLAIEKQLAQRIKDDLQIKNLEEQNGYSGEKDENYKERYNLAREFYMSVPKDTAIYMLGSNYALKDYLGLYYERLASELQNRRG